MPQITVSPVFVDHVTAVGVMAKHGSWLKHFLNREHTTSIQKAYHKTNGFQYYPSLFRHYFTPHKPEEQSVLVMDGSSLAGFRTTFDNDYVNKMVRLVAVASLHFSRIDISLDLMDNGLFAHAFASDCRAGKVNLGKRKPAYYEKNGGVSTYIGARTSPKMLRVYDKNAESEGKNPATRFEFELKAEAANIVSDRIQAFEGYKLFTGFWIGLMLEFADWSIYPDIEQILIGEVETIDLPPRERLLDKKTWLRKQVLPTFIKDWNGTGHELWEWFQQTVEESKPEE